MTDAEATEPVTADGKVRIFLNTNANMTRGKAAAHAVHAALIAFGVHPDVPVVVLGGKPADIEKMRTAVRDAGRTELEPGTLTAGTDYVPSEAVLLAAARRAAAVGRTDHPGYTVEQQVDDRMAETRGEYWLGVARAVLGVPSLPVADG